MLGVSFGLNNLRSRKKNNETLYGVGKYIDTSQSFNVSVRHLKNQVVVKLNQNGRSIWNEITDEEYIADLHLDENVYTPIISLWSGDMTWLDSGMGTESADDYSYIEAVLSHFSIRNL
jgi:hypothetical protein